MIVNEGETALLDLFADVPNVSDVTTDFGQIVSGLGSIMSLGEFTNTGQNLGREASYDVALGDIDSTFKILEAGIENRDPLLIDSLVAIWWDPIRDDPRFDEMLELLDSKVTHTEQYLRDHKVEESDQ